MGASDVAVGPWRHDGLLSRGSRASVQSVRRRIAHPVGLAALNASLTVRPSHPPTSWGRTIRLESANLPYPARNREAAACLAREMTKLQIIACRMGLAG